MTPSIPTALFGIEDGSLNLAINLLILILVVIWIALIWWTYADARRRLDDNVLVVTATAASLFPFIGTAIYSILRPPEYLADARERDLETKAAELRLRRLAETSCPRCEHPIELSWLRCPECQHGLKDPCRSCGRPVDPRWAICPHCEAPVAGSSSGSQRRQQPREGAQRSRQPSARKRPAGDRPAKSRSEGERPSQERPTTQRRAPSKSGQPAKSRPRKSAPSSSSSRPESSPPEGSQRQADGADSERSSRRKPTSRT